MIRVDPATVTTEPAHAQIERRIAMLTRLAEIGMEIAEEAGRQATGKVEGTAIGTPMRDPGLVYTRVARAVRMTLWLQSRLMDELAALGRAEDLARAERTRRVDRMVERAVETGHGEGDEGEPLWGEARERLADADLDAEIDGLSYSEVVARICGDLGLPADRTARIVAAAETAEGPPAASWPGEASAGPSRDPAPGPPGPVGGGPAARPRPPPH